MKKCSKCGKSGKFYFDPCGKCRHKEQQRLEHKSLMPRFNVVYRK